MTGAARTEESPVQGTRDVRQGNALPRWVYWLLFVLALGLRLYRLGAQCFWYDEAQTLLVAGLPWGEIVQVTYRPPLYHFLLHLWAGLVPGTEFWLRLPSAALGALVPPLICMLGTRVYGRRTGFVGGMLAIISPTLVAYAQELRMYSLMAAAFALLLWFSSSLLRRQRAGAWSWAGYGLTGTAALYTHYFALPFLITLAACGLVFLLSQRRYDILRRWIAVHLISAVAFTPWVLVILSGRGGAEDFTQAEVSPILSEVPGVTAFLHRVWLFYVTGPVTSDWTLLRAWAQVALIGFLAVGLVFALGALRCAVRRSVTDGAKGVAAADLVLLALVVMPLCAAGIMYGLRPGTVHPRHLMMISVPFTLVLARIATWIWDSERPRESRAIGFVVRAGAALLLVGLAGLFTLSTVLYYADPALQRADVRLLAQYVEKETGPGDVVFMPYRDYAFEHYFHGPAATLYLETRVGDVELLDWVLPQMKLARRAVLVRWVHVLSDPRNALDWFLESNGRLEERVWLADRWANVYALGDEIALPRLAPAKTAFGPVTLSSVRIQETLESDDTLAIALRWRLDEATTDDLKASVRLVDAGGAVVVADDRVLLAEHTAASTSRWTLGEEAHNYYLLDIPSGTPPVEYHLTLTVYRKAGPLIAKVGDAIDGTTVDLGAVTLLPGQTPDGALPDGIELSPIDRELASGLTLAALGPLPESIGPGETLPITLYWRADAALPALEPTLRLVDAKGAVLAETSGVPVYGLYPTNRWRAGETVTEHRTLRVAVNAASGIARLQVVLDEQVVDIGRITIKPSERSFAPVAAAFFSGVSFERVARLSGADISPASIQAGAPLSVTLYWEALTGVAAPDYVVFVQLLSSDGAVVAQHDGVPAGGRWPTSNWEMGQVITDRHELEWYAPEYHGQARLIVGLYETATQQRLVTDQGRDYAELAGLVVR
jgi:mannosyltransferase